jgi:tetratricopeptide (TPR) repeat protein
MPGAATVNLVLCAALLLTTAVTSSAEWLSVQSDHFQVIGNASERELRDIALRFEQFREFISQATTALRREAAAPPVVVIVFRDRKSYEPFLPQANGRPMPVAGYFQPGQDVNYITLSLQAGQDAYPLVFHEFSHLILRSYFADAPVWFNEGLAEYYSTFEVMANGRRATVGKPVSRHVALLKERRLPLTRFFSIDRDSPAYTRDTTDRDVLYAQSWAVVHHAFHGPSRRRDQLLSFVNRLADGAGPQEAFRAAYGIELGDLETELQVYVQNRIYEYLTFELPESLVTRIKPEIGRISDAEADAWLGDLLAHLGRTEDAEARLAKALAADSKLAMAHASLGALRSRQGKHAEAMPYFKQAVALGTTNEAALFAYAYALATQGTADRDGTSQAARLLERAIELRAGYTDAKELLAYVYLVEGRYEDVRTLLTPVVRAEPTNHDAALRLADALLRLDDLAGARALIGPVLARATDAGMRERARRMLAVSAGIETRRQTFAAAGLSPAGSPAAPAGAAAGAAGMPQPSRAQAIIPDLRPVAAGEQRLYGIFEAVDCSDSGIRLVVRSASALWRARAAKMSDIDFIAYRQLSTASVNCGRQTPPMPVYLTVRPAPDGAAGADPIAVAVEILPEGFIP